jgi:hypothetical protein
MLSACAAFFLAVLPARVAGQDGGAAPVGEASETKDRLSPERMAALVSVPMSIVETDGLPAGKAAFERLLAAARVAHGERSVEVADLLTAFGVGLYTFGQDSEDRRIGEASIAYLEAAIPAYRAAFGDAHPEVAVALNSYADVQSALHENDPPQSAETALEEAYRIRLGAFGPTNIETLASLRYLARARGLPSRTRGDPARIEAAAGLFRQLIARSSNDAQPRYLSAPYGRTALARMCARNGMAGEAREQLRLAAEQAARWDETERCAFVAGETAEIESILAGEAVGKRESILSRLDALAGCSAPEDDPAEERPAISSPA